MKTIALRTSETGAELERFDTLDEAIIELKENEKEDLLNGDFEENYYEIYDIIKQEVIFR